MNKQQIVHCTTQSCCKVVVNASNVSSAFYLDLLSPVLLEGRICGILLQEKSTDCVMKMFTKSFSYHSLKGIILFSIIALNVLHVFDSNSEG